MMADPFIVSLSERMVDALNGKPIDSRADRLIAYFAAGISLADIRDEDWHDADEMARLEELSRRLTA